MTKYGVLGTGMVGEAIASKLIALGHEVRMGSRTANNEKGAAWAAKSGDSASIGTFAETAAFGEMLFLCTSGTGSVDAVAAAASALTGKILVDVTNPLDFSHGMPPSLFTPSTESLGERVQRAAPKARVVKALNTINADVMVDPSKVPGDHDLLIAGNDAEAKAAVTSLLQVFGWKSILDVGDITGARALEAYVLLWVRLWGVLKTPNFNLKIVR